jgi:hypothetical protein
MYLEEVNSVETSGKDLKQLIEDAAAEQAPCEAEAASTDPSVGPRPWLHDGVIRTWAY